MTEITSTRAPRRAAVADDAEAFMRLVAPYRVQLRALAFRLLGTRSDMDDAIQDALVRAFRSRHQLANEAGVGAWLHRITYNVCIDHLRRRRRRPSLPLDDAGRELRAPGDVSEVTIDRQRLAEALASLPADQRAVVLMVDAHGLGYEEAADALGVAVGTVRSRLSRARAVLRARLAEGGSHG